MSEIITAVKRLERAGSTESGATRKLQEAAAALGEHLRLTVLTGVEVAARLPRGYEVGPGGYVWTAEWGQDGIASRLDELSRREALELAKDVADGWLDELAAWLEARAQEADRMVTALTI